MRSKAVPTKSHLEWADMEIGVLIHYLVNIYEPDFEDYKTDAVRTVLSPDKFICPRLDPEQWVRSAAELGAKYAVFVANHCTGFSLWQTEVNDYSCASMKWKDGKGDIFAEFVQACKKYGIKPGVYYSTGCNGYYNINDEEEHDYNADYYKEYVRCVERQVTELWSKYGDMFEIWFDGGIVPYEEGGPDILTLLKKYQPDAVAFQGPKGFEHNLRWVGNELGFAPEECWATADTLGDNAGSPDGEFWMPAETDFPNRSTESFGGGWGWKENEEQYVYTPEHLLECYVNSVGRNSNMLIGMAISKDGDFQDEQQFIDFGRLLKKTFGSPLAEIKDIKGDTVCLKNESGAAAKYLVICENIINGQSVRAFSVYAGGEKISWGRCIGHKRIIPLENGTAGEYTVKITEADGDIDILSAALY